MFPKIGRFSYWHCGITQICHLFFVFLSNPIAKSLIPTLKDRDYSLCAKVNDSAKSNLQRQLNQMGFKVPNLKMQISYICCIIFSVYLAVLNMSIHDTVHFLHKGETSASPFVMSGSLNHTDCP